MTAAIVFRWVLRRFLAQFAVEELSRALDELHPRTDNTLDDKAAKLVGENKAAIINFLKGL